MLFPVEICSERSLYKKWRTACHLKNGIQDVGSEVGGQFPEQRIAPVKLGDVKLVIHVCFLFLRSVLWMRTNGCSNAGLVTKFFGDV